MLNVTNLPPITGFPEMFYPTLPFGIVASTRKRCLMKDRFPEALLHHTAESQRLPQNFQPRPALWESGGMNDVPTVIIPVRIDSPDRLENFKCLITFLHTAFPAWPVAVKEAGPKICVEEFIPNLPHYTYAFEYSDSPHFHKTRHINELLFKHVKTSVTIMNDVDCFASPEMYQNTFRRTLAEWDVIIMGTTLQDVPRPSVAQIEAFSKTSQTAEWGPPLITNHGANWTGRIVFTKTNVYKTIGGENEGFEGWGPEDLEKANRMQKLGFKLTREPGTVYHMDHPTLPTSRNNSDPVVESANRLWQKIQEMSVDELKRYYGLTW